MALRIAIAGPTGEIGISTIEALGGHAEVARIIGLARRPFNATERGCLRLNTAKATSSTAIDGIIAVGCSGSDIANALRAFIVAVDPIGLYRFLAD
jgi:hypothetical protein